MVPARLLAVRPRARARLRQLLPRLRRAVGGVLREHGNEPGEGEGGAGVTEPVDSGVGLQALLKDAISNWHPIHTRLLTDGKWQKAGTYMDALDDATRDVEAYDRARSVASWEEHQTEIRNLFGAFYTQHESVIGIARLVGMDKDKRSDADLFENNGIRNKLMHPDKGYVLHTHMTEKPKFHLIKYPRDESRKELHDAAERQDAQTSAIQRMIGDILTHLRRERREWAESAQESGDVPLLGVLKFLEYPVSKVGDRDPFYEEIKHREVARAVTSLRERLLRLEYNDELLLYELDVADAGLEMWRKSMAEAWPKGSEYFLIRGLRQSLGDLRNLASAIDAYIAAAAAEITVPT